jgi:hypothetical protein
MLVERDGHTLRFTADYSPGTPDVMYLPNGDPGYPGDPEEFEVTQIELRVQVADDLDCHPDCKRAFWVDVTDLLFAVEGYTMGAMTDAAYRQFAADQEAARDDDAATRYEAAQAWKDLP